jgi:PAS domain S-box-containing protein
MPNKDHWFDEMAPDQSGAVAEGWQQDVAAQVAAVAAAEAIAAEAAAEVAAEAAATAEAAVIVATAAATKATARAIQVAAHAAEAAAEAAGQRDSGLAGRGNRRSSRQPPVPAETVALADSRDAASWDSADSHEAAINAAAAAAAAAATAVAKVAMAVAAAAAAAAVAALEAADLIEGTLIRSAAEAAAAVHQKASVPGQGTNVPPAADGVGDGLLTSPHTTVAQRVTQGPASRSAFGEADLIAALHAARVDRLVAMEELATAKAELQRRESFTDALLETIEVGIVFCDASGANWIRNRAERALLGLEAAAAQGLAPADAASRMDVLDVDGERIPVEGYPLLRALRGENPGVVELLLGPSGGPHREVISRNSQILGLDGEVLGAVSALTDVSSERAMARALAVEQQRLTEAQRVGRLGSFEYDYVTDLWTFSEQLGRIWGLELDRISATTLNSLVVEGDREQLVQLWHDGSRRGGHHSHTYRILRADDGDERVISTRFEVELGPDENPRHCRGTHLDITEITAAQQAAQQANAFFDAVLSATPDFTYVTDLATGLIIYGSHDMGVLGMTSAELQDLSGDDRLALVHPDDQHRPRATNTDVRAIDDGQVLQLRYRAMHADGQWRWLNSRVTPFRRDSSGAVVEVLTVLRDITEAVESEDRLAHKALHDELTGLANRTWLVDRLDTTLGRAGSDGQEVAVLFCDLDSFKRVNDTSGHAAGDAVLLEVAQRLNSTVPDGAAVARVGGNEFVIVINTQNQTSASPQPGPDGSLVLTDRFGAVQVAERFIEAMRQPIIVNGCSHVVTASIGITYAAIRSQGHADRTTADQTLQDADAAMYRAKSRGKNCYALFEPELRTELAERGHVEQMLRGALNPPTGESGPGFVSVPRSNNPTLSAVYQPIFDSGSRRLVGFEALARLIDADGVNIPPDVFIAVAEDTGLIHTLGAVMLDLACSQLRAWRTQTPGLEHVSMAVNMSALQAHDASLGHDVRGALTRHRLQPKDLVLELTETALLRAAPSTITILRALHTDGLGIAIDDFGTGYASLRYLATLPVTAIKVDRSFTAGLPHDETSLKIVNAVAGLAADMEIGCVVEGVETAEQLAALPAGVQVQGYLTGRPAPALALDLRALAADGAP